MAGATTPTILKADGSKQRSDIILTDKVAGALVQKVFSGQNLFIKDQDIEITYIGEEGEEITEKLSQNTVHSWIKRNNVVPTTGETLRDLLNRAREDYRTTIRKKRQDMLVESAEQRMSRVMNLRTTVPIRNMFGQIVKNEDGSIARRENHNVLRIQMDTAKYVTERLDPARYGRVERTENKHLIFSLADLRKSKQQGEKENG